MWHMQVGHVNRPLVAGQSVSKSILTRQCACSSFFVPIVHASSQLSPSPLLTRQCACSSFFVPIVRASSQLSPPPLLTRQCACSSFFVPIMLAANLVHHPLLTRQGTCSSFFVPIVSFVTNKNNECTIRLPLFIS